MSYLNKHKDILQVDTIDNGKKVIFKKLNKTKMVNDIVASTANYNISLPDNLKDGRYLLFTGIYTKTMLICQIEKGKLKGNVEEYDKNGNLIFEGDYINNCRYGKGKEYYKNGNVMFEGEYINNYRNGKGKEYDENENVIFEGEYINNCRNGKCKEYDKNRNVIFDGEYKDGKKWKGQEYDKNRKLIFDGEYKDGLRWNGQGKIYIKTKDGGYIEKECNYNEGNKNGYEVLQEYYNGRNVRVIKYKDNKAVELSFYVNGEECSKVNLIDGIYTHTNSTKTNYKDTNVVVYGLTEETLSDTTRKIRDKFGEKTQLLIKSNMDHEPDDDIKIAQGTDKLELFINFHGEDNLEEHPIHLHDIRPISKKVSNAIVSSNGQIKTLTIKLDNCYGRTYDMNGNDLKAELLKDIYNKALEQAEGKTLDLNTLPTILISGATIDSVVFDYGSTNETKKIGCKRIAKKEYFSFGQKDWKMVAKIMEERNKNNKDGNNKNTINEEDSKIDKELDNNLISLFKEIVAKIIKEHKENNKDGNNKNTINDENGKIDKELDNNLISLFTEINQKDYRKLKGYYSKRDNINNKETTKTENNKGNNIGNV